MYIYIYCFYIILNYNPAKDVNHSLSSISFPLVTSSSLLLEPMSRYDSASVYSTLILRNDPKV